MSRDGAAIQVNLESLTFIALLVAEFSDELAGFISFKLAEQGGFLLLHLFFGEDGESILRLATARAVTF